MGDELGESGYMCMYGWVLSLLPENYHNISAILQNKIKSKWTLKVEPDDTKWKQVAGNKGDYFINEPIIFRHVVQLQFTCIIWEGYEMDTKGHQMYTNSLMGGGENPLWAWPPSNYSFSKEKLRFSS